MKTYTLTEELREKLLRCSDYKNVEDTVGFYQRAYAELLALTPNQPTGSVVEEIEAVLKGPIEEDEWMEEEHGVKFRSMRRLAEKIANRLANRQGGMNK